MVSGGFEAEEEDAVDAEEVGEILGIKTYGLWGKSFQDFFAATMKHAEENRGIPGAAISMYWRRRISVTLHKTMAKGILSRAGRLNSGPFRDESSWEGVMESQSYQR